MIRLAATLYGLFVGAAVLWCWLAGRFPWPLYDPAVSTRIRLVLGLGVGLALGLLVVGASRLMVTRLRWARTLYRFFRETLGPLTGRQILALALLSSVGEELFFRGAMQPAWGVGVATLVFAVLHFPSRLALWPWTVMAGVLGLAFGYLTLWSGSVAGATLAHFLVNLLNLGQIASAEKLLDPAAVGRMGDHEACPSDSCVRDPHAAPDSASRGAEPQ